MNQKMVVAFIDILGMSNFAENTMAAGEVLSNPNDILNSKISDGKNFPIENYQIERVKKIAEKKLITSFDNFITFSDSIFITSCAPDLFLNQLGNFVLACFTYNANDYAYPDDKTSPCKVKIPVIISKDGKTEKKIQEENHYPCLFRGGMAWGQAMLIPGKGIINKKPIDANILIGKAVVEAYYLEKRLKGPRIGFEEEFYSQLNEDTRKYVGKTEMGHYELLWPAFTYLNIDNGFECSKFTTLFDPAVNLWNAFNHEPYGEHYFKFLKLIVLSTMKVYENTEGQNDCEAYIKSEIRRKGLELEEKVLFEKYS